MAKSRSAEQEESLRFMPAEPQTSRMTIQIALNPMTTDRSGAPIGQRLENREIAYKHEHGKYAYDTGIGSGRKTR